jgi:hypothetical protein
MSDLAYFEYGLVLPEERYLIEVQTRREGGPSLIHLKRNAGAMPESWN